MRQPLLQHLGRVVAVPHGCSAGGAEIGNGVRAKRRGLNEVDDRRSGGRGRRALAHAKGVVDAAAAAAASRDFGGLGDAGDGAEAAAAGGNGGGAARGGRLRRGGGDFFGAGGAVVAVGVVAGPGRVGVVFGFEFGGGGLLLLMGGEPGEVEVGGVEEGVPFGGGGDFVGWRRRGGHRGGGEDGVVGVVGLRGGDSHDVGWASGREAGGVVDPVVVLRVVLTVSCWRVVVLRRVVLLEPALLPKGGHAGW